MMETGSGSGENLSGSGGNLSGSGGNLCAQFDECNYDVTVAVRTLVAVVSFICCATVVFLILLYKQYCGFVQRLILYTCTASALNSLIIACQKVDYFGSNNVTEVYCVIVGFLFQYTSLVELLAVMGLTLGLYVNIFSHKLRKRVEILCVILVLIFPALVSWPPFINNSYGKTGPWCWIRDRDENCEVHVLGVILQYLLWYLPLVIVITTVVSVYLFAYIKLRKSIKGTWARPYDPEVQLTREQLRKNVRLLLTYIPLLYVLFSLAALPNAIYWSFGDNPILELWILHAVVLPLRGTLFAIPYIFNKHTRKKITQTKLRVRNNQVSKRASSVNPYPALTSRFTDSLHCPYEEDNTLARNKVYRNPSLSQSPVEVVPHSNGKDNMVVTIQQNSETCATTKGNDTQAQLTISSITEESGTNA